MTSVNGVLCFSLNLEAPVKQKRLVCSAATHKAVLPPPCGMPGVVDRTGSALRASCTGLCDLRLGLLTRVYARRLRVHVDAGRDAGRGAATSVGDFGRRLRAAISGGDFGRRLQPRLRAAMWSCDFHPEFDRDFHLRPGSSGLTGYG